MKRVVFPEEWECDIWHGFKRHHFMVDGYKAWIVEPEYPAGDGRWSWCAIWPEAFVERVGIVGLLQHGFYHGHVDVYSTSASPAGLQVMAHFQDKLVELGLSPKANLIGMSWGGFFSLRYAEENPERVCAIYLDAPVCDAADDDDKGDAINRLQKIMKNYGMSREELVVSKLNPINNLEPLAVHRIPMMACVGMADQVVIPERNIEVVVSRLKEMGYTFEVDRREDWSHHPHGVDDIAPLLRFHVQAREE